MKRSEFLAAVFPADLMEKDESPLISYPDEFTDDNDCLVQFHRQSYWQPRAAGVDSRDEGWLYCVSTVNKSKEKARRRAVDVRNAFVVPCDDVGTKSAQPHVAPSYVLETSLYNYQYGYLIDPFDVSPESDGGFEYYDGVLLGLAHAGYNDIGCRSATRVIKLPGAVHHSGFVTKLIGWYPERVWHLPDLVEEMGIEVAEVSRKTYTPVPEACSVDGILDATYHWLEANGHTFGVGGGGFINIRCPWAHEHSNPSAFLAGYSPDGYGGEGRGFKCFHGHCAHHKTIDLIQWVFEQGGQSLPY